MPSTSLQTVGSGLFGAEEMYPTMAFGYDEQYASDAMTAGIQSLAAELEEARAWHASAAQVTGPSVDIDFTAIQYRFDHQESLKQSEYETHSEAIDFEQEISTADNSNSYRDAAGRFTSDRYIPSHDYVARLKAVLMQDRSFYTLPQYLQDSWLRGFPGASMQAQMIRWKDVFNHNHKPRAVNFRKNPELRKSSYRCPIVIGGSPCITDSSSNANRLIHMARHFEGIFLCPGVCPKPWFHTRSDLEQHLKHEKNRACRVYYAPDVNYKVREHRWLEYPQFIDMGSLPKGDPLHGYMVDNARNLVKPFNLQLGSAFLP